MTFTLPAHRNSFHPAWLLLPLVPLLHIYIGTALPAESVRPIHIVQLLLSLCWVVPWIWWRAGTASGPLPRLLKEFRGQLPGFLIAVWVPGLMGLGESHESVGPMIPVFGLGCLMMGAGLFGGEFEHRTLSSLLAQPLSRFALYREKMGVLAVTLGYATVNVLLILLGLPDRMVDQDAFLIMPAFALYVFASAPLFTLVTRSTLAGLVFTVGVPPGIAFALSLLWTGLLNLTGHPNYEPPDPWGPIVLTFLALLYFGGVIGMGWRTFSRLDAGETDTGSTPVNLHRFGNLIDALLARILRPGPTASLLRKEFRLHVIPWLVAVVLVIFSVFLIVGRDWVDDSALHEALASPMLAVLVVALLGVLSLLGTGAAAVAEERQLGTLDWQLTQPATLRRQWWVKAGTTFGLGITLGALLPLALLRVVLPADDFLKDFHLGEPLPTVGLGVAVLTFLITSLYASSLCRSTMKAVATATGLCAGIVGVVALSNAGLEPFLDSLQGADAPQVNLPADWLDHVVWASWVPALGVTVIAVVIFALLLTFAARNFRYGSVSARQMVRQVTSMALVLLFLYFGGTACALEVLRRVIQAHAQARIQNDPVPVPATAVTLAGRYHLTGDAAKYGLRTGPPPVPKLVPSSSK